MSAPSSPATRNSSHDLFASSRNRAIDDPTVEHELREWQCVGFGLQGKAIIEAAARMIGDNVDPLARKAVLLPTHAVAVRVRRTLADDVAG